MENTVKERLTKYLSYKKISKSAFGRTIGVSSAYISSMRKSIQPDKLQGIALNYPDLNIEWLQTGDGEMLKSPQAGGVFATNSSGNSAENLTDEAMTMQMMSRLVAIMENQSNQMDRVLGQQDKLIEEVSRAGDRTERAISVIEHLEGVQRSQKRGA